MSGQGSDDVNLGRPPWHVSIELCSTDSFRLFKPRWYFEMKLSKLDRGPFDHSGHKLMRSDLFWFSFLGMIPLIRSTLPKPQTLFKFLSLNDFLKVIKSLVKYGLLTLLAAKF